MQDSLKAWRQATADMSEASRRAKASKTALLLAIREVVARSFPHAVAETKGCVRFYIPADAGRFDVSIKVQSSGRVFLCGIWAGRSLCELDDYARDNGGKSWRWCRVAEIEQRLIVMREQLGDGTC